MRSTRWKIDRSHLIRLAAALMAAGSLTACAGRQQDFRATLASHDRRIALADDKGAAMPLPDMTSADYERLGDVNLNRGDFAMAFVSYEKSLELDPGNARIHYKRGRTFLSAGKNEDALQEFEDVLRQAPQYAPACEGMGQACFQMANDEAAAGHFAKALALDPSLWRAHAYLGVVYDHQKRYPLAIAQYEQAIQLRPQEGCLYNNLGVCYSLAGRPEEAVAAFYSALQRRCAPGKVYNNLGVALARMGRDEEALAAFRKAGNEAQAYNNLGCTYLERNELENAISCFEKAIALNPTFYIKANENMKKAKFALKGK